MKWLTSRGRHEREHSKGWQKWFAWYPVVVDGQKLRDESWCWLETVERRHGLDHEYFYRTTES